MNWLLARIEEEEDAEPLYAVEIEEDNKTEKNVETKEKISVNNFENESTSMKYAGGIVQSESLNIQINGFE